MSGSLFDHATRDPQIITSSWGKLRRLIAGVVVHEVLSVPGDRGALTELWRAEWDPSGLPIQQVFEVRLFPGSLSAWHCHAGATDRLFATRGLLKLALYDDREGSPTRGLVNELHVGETRPALVIVPPGVWHGVKCLGAGEGVLVNMPSEPYCYEDPDHWRLPADTPEIPYRW